DARGVELLRGLGQVALAHDVVSVEHLAGLPAHHLHRDPFGNARSHEVPYRRSSEVLEDAAWAAGELAGGRPRLVEAPDWFAVPPREDVRDYAAELLLPFASDRTPVFEQHTELGCEREHAPLPRLRSAWVEAHLARLEVDLRPMELRHLRPPPPAGDVKEGHEVRQV